MTHPTQTTQNAPNQAFKIQELFWSTPEKRLHYSRTIPAATIKTADSLPSIRYN
jgi:hypothetical protein